MSDDKLTTQKVRDVYKWGATACGCCTLDQESDGEDFDAWLAEHDAEIRREIADKIAAEYDELAVTDPRQRGPHLVGALTAYDVAEQIARGEA